MTAPVGTRYVMLPDWLPTKVSGTAVAVWSRIARRGTWDAETGAYVECWPARETVADELRVSLSTVKRAIAELKDAGALEQYQSRRPVGQWGVNRYRAIVGPQPWLNGRDVEPDELTDEPRSDEPWSTSEPRRVIGDPGVTGDPDTSTNVSAPRCQEDSDLAGSDRGSPVAPDLEPLPLQAVDLPAAQPEGHQRPDDGASAPPTPLVGEDLSSRHGPAVATPPDPNGGVDLTAPPTRQDRLAPEFVGIQRDIARAYDRHGIAIRPDEVRAVHTWLRHAPNVRDVEVAWLRFARTEASLLDLLGRVRQDVLARRAADAIPCPHGEPGGVVPRPAGPGGGAGLMECPLCRLGAAAAPAAPAVEPHADRVVREWAKAADMARGENRRHLGVILDQAERFLAHGLDVTTLVSIAQEAGKRGIDLRTYAARVVNFTSQEGSRV